MFWSLISASEVGFALYVGPSSPGYQILYYARSLSYLLVVGFWSVSLWHNEPARKPIDPKLQKYVLALHNRVRYDLGQAGH